MINSKNKKLSSILESRNGLHLTAYINFDGDIVRFREKLKNLLETAEEHLSPVLSAADKKQFLSPVKALGFDSEALRQIKGNIAIFRKNNFFQFISLPVEVKETCVVADTFHIKPMIKWAQQDQEFLIVGLTVDGALIYKGSQTKLNQIDPNHNPESLKHFDYGGRYASLKQKRLQKAEHQHTMKWLSKWVESLVKGNDITVFVAGNKENVSTFIKYFKSDALFPETIAPHFSSEHVYKICKNIRALLRLDSRMKLYETLREFQMVQNTSKAETNIFQIAKLAMKGNVKKLLIAEDLNVFGKIDLSTYNVSLHPLDMDHEDDCLLDDLAQTVLLNGGEVIVAKRNEIPKQRPIMALLNNQPPEIYATGPMSLYGEMAI